MKEVGNENICLNFYSDIRIGQSLDRFEESMAASELNISTENSIYLCEILYQKYTREDEKFIK